MKRDSWFTLGDVTRAGETGHAALAVDCGARGTRTGKLTSFALATLLVACAAQDGEEAATVPPLDFPMDPADGLRGGFPVTSDDVIGEAKEVEPDDAYALDPSNKGGLLLRTQQSPAEMFIWAANERDVQMKPTNSHICFLTKVSGNFGGHSAVMAHRSTVDVKDRCADKFFESSSPIVTDPSKLLINDDVGPTWKLGGCQKESNSLGAEATCVPITSFQVDAGAGVFMSNFKEAFARSAGTTSSVALVTAHAISYISAIKGFFNGGGEKAQIIYNWNDWTAKLQVWNGSSIQRSQVDATAYSFYAGSLTQPRGTTRIGGFNVDAKDGSSKTVTLTTTQSAVCYLTRVSGSLDGGGERIRIFPQVNVAGVENWVLEARSQSGGSAYGSAECVYYDQRTLPPLL